MKIFKIMSLKIRGYKKFRYKGNGGTFIGYKKGNLSEIGNFEKYRNK